VRWRFRAETDYLIIEEDGVEWKILMSGRYWLIGLLLLASGGLVFLPGPSKKFNFNRQESESQGAGRAENGAANLNQPLAAPPLVIKAIYATSWSAGDSAKINDLINLIKKTELNAIVIDIKDFSGLVAYDINLDEVNRYHTKEIRIADLDGLIRRLHQEGIYVIGRLTVFQDPALAQARPDWAVKDRRTGQIWRDRKGLAWVDPANHEVWDYNVKIAADAARHGFDEINFDYIRFPSDGEISVLAYPFYHEEQSSREAVIKDFLIYLRSQLKGVKISADLFGLTTVAKDDMGIGQIIEDAYENFDFVSPMVYPSHYASGFGGHKNPAAFPYEVIHYSLERALVKRSELASSVPEAKLAELRPWLQDFDLGADYDASMVRAEIKAVEDLGLRHGWMLWDPANNYSKEALREE